MQPEVAESPLLESAEPAASQESAPSIRRWVTFEDSTEVDADDLVFDGSGIEAVAALCAGVILAGGDEQRAATLLAAGADCVYIGEPALLDSTLIDRLAAAYGANHVGIYAPLKRQNVSWSFETVSNADFKTVTPSHCEPAWEVLRADGTGTGTLASWWLKAMRELGATRFLVRVDIRDDTDLNLCAGLIEDLGDALWVGPLEEPAVRLADWVEYGRCRQLVLSPAAYAQRDILFGASEASR